MEVYIVGEDSVTYAIIKRVLSYCSPQVKIISELPARGGQVKSKITEFNKLSLSYPVILLIDLDNETCAPLLLEKLTCGNKNDNFIFNIAIDEAEAWLMADKEGFSEYFRIDIEDMPVSTQQKQGGRTPLIEMYFPYKSSMYLTHELIKKSKKEDYVLQLTAKKGAVKGPEYNNCMLPFIQQRWDIDVARVNADSLNRMIERIQTLINKSKKHND